MRKPLFLILGIAGLWVQVAQAADLNSPRPQDRVAAIQAIEREIPDVKWIDPLLKALSDPQFSVRRQALRTWANIGNELDSEFWDDLHEQTRDTTDRLIAAHRLWAKKIASQVERGDEALTFEALRTLCALGRSTNLVCYYPGCGTGYDESLESEILDQLGPVAKSHEEVLRKLVDDSDPAVVLNALRQFGSRALEMGRHRIDALLRSRQREARGIGVWLVNELPMATAHPYVKQLLEDRDSEIADLAAYLWRISPEEALAWTDANSGNSVKVRRFAIDRLIRARADSPEVRLQLDELMKDREPEIRAAALRAVVQWPAGDLDDVFSDFGLLRKFLSDPAPEVRAQALQLAASVEMPDLLPFVKAGLADSARAVRQAALNCFGPHQFDSLIGEGIEAVAKGVDNPSRIHPKFDDAALIDRCLNSKETAMRMMLAQAIKQVPADRRGAVCHELANDRDPGVATWAMYGLSAATSEDDYRLLVRLASSAQSEVRIEAIQYLGDSRRREALPVLQKFRFDRDGKTRGLARWAIMRLKKSLGTSS